MKNKNEWLMWVVYAIVVTILGNSLVSAEIQTLPTQNQNNCQLIEQTCSSCTYVNFESMRYPNQSMIYYNIPMVKEGNKFSYSFCNTTQLGTYIVTTCGDVDGVSTCVDYNFYIKHQYGIELTTINYILIAILIITVLLLFYLRLFLVAGIILLFVGIIAWFSLINPILCAILILGGVVLFFVK